MIRRFFFKQLNNSSHSLKEEYFMLLYSRSNVIRGYFDYEARAVVIGVGRLDYETVDY